MTHAAAAQPLQNLTLGGGCFWCLDAVYRRVRGVVAVESGYCNGHVPQPSYEQVCRGDTGHAEVVRLQFDPAQVSARELLEIFFCIHDPTTPNRQGNDVGPQYRSVIFATSEAQLHTALATIEALGERRVFPKAIVTRVERAPRFWPAEPEHHDYYVNNSDQPYCQYVVAPKITKFRSHFDLRRWPEGSR